MMIRTLALTLSIALMPAAAKSADLVSAMTRYDGMHERTHRRALKKMLGIDPARVPWCGAMLTYAARKSGKRPPAGSLKAASWRHYGKAVKRSNARRNDIVVVRHGGHVIVFSHWNGRKACGPSGNSSNRVQTACYSGVIAVRR